MLTETKTTRLLAACVEDGLMEKRKRPSINLYAPRDSQDSSKSDLVSLSWLQRGNLLKIPPIDQDDYASPTYLSSLPKVKSNKADLDEKNSNQDEIPENEGRKLPSSSPTKGTTNLSKPNYSYTHLIFMAIESTPNKYMTVNQIYNWCETNFPFYKHAGTGWKNSLRHNLSINKSFKRLPRDNRGSGRGAYWAVEPRERQNLIDGLNRNPWNATAIAFSGGPKINESGHMNVTGTLNSLGCNRYSNFNQASFLRNISKNTFIQSLTSNEMGQTALTTSQYFNNQTNNMVLLKRLPAHNGTLPQSQLTSSIECLIEYQKCENPYSCIDSPKLGTSLGTSINSTGSSSLLSVSDSYLSSFFNNSIGNTLQACRKYFSDNSNFLELAFSQNLDNWTEEEDNLYLEAIAAMQENHENQKVKFPEPEKEVDKPISRLLQTVAKIGDKSQQKAINPPQVVTKQRRKSNLKPTLELESLDYNKEFPSASRGQCSFSKIGYKVMKTCLESNTNTNSVPDEPKAVKCSECKENSSITSSSVKTESVDVLKDNVDPCINETIRRYPLKEKKSFCENCVQSKRSDNNNQIRYYNESEWFSIYPHLKKQQLEQDLANSNVNWSFSHLNDDVLNCLDVDQETGPAGFPVMMLPFAKMDDPNNEIIQDDEKVCLPKADDIYITPACSLDHEYAHCQGQLRTPKDQAIISKYNNKVKAYLELVKSTLSTTPNAVISPFEMFLNDSPLGNSTSNNGSCATKLSRRQKQLNSNSNSSEKNSSLKSPSNHSQKVVTKKRIHQKSKLDNSFNRRASTRQIRAPKRPYDDVSFTGLTSSDDDEDDYLDYRQKRTKVTLPPDLPLVSSQQSSGSPSKSSFGDTRDDEDEDFDDSIENSTEMNSPTNRGKKTSEDDSKSLDDDWVSDIEDQYKMYCAQKTRYYQNKKQQSAGLLNRFSESEDDFDDQDEDGLDSEEEEYFSLARRRTFGNISTSTKKTKPITDLTQLKNVFLRQSRKFSNLAVKSASSSFSNDDDLSSSKHDTSTETIRME